MAKKYQGSASSYEGLKHRRAYQHQIVLYSCSASSYEGLKLDIHTADANVRDGSASSYEGLKQHRALSGNGSQGRFSKFL